MKQLSLLIVMFTIGYLSGCTENQKAKSWGGKAEITLPKGQKLVIATWKDDDLWYLTRPMVSGDSAVTYTFQEKSSFGIMQGSYVIHEIK